MCPASITPSLGHRRWAPHASDSHQRFTAEHTPNTAGFPSGVWALGKDRKCFLRREMLALDSAWVSSHEQAKMLAGTSWMKLRSSWQELRPHPAAPDSSHEGEKSGLFTELWWELCRNHKENMDASVRALWTSAVSSKMTRRVSFPTRWVGRYRGFRSAMNVNKTVRNVNNKN